MNRIVIELDQEDRNRLDRIAGFLEELTKNRANQTTQVPEPEQPEPQPTEQPEQPKPDLFEQPKELKQAEPTIDRADIQRLVVKLSAAGKKAQVREIITAVADKVSSIPDDKLASVWEQLTALEG